jgi:phosphoglycolate phosphatase-like HAD superfamily hydrolase
MRTHLFKGLPVVQSVACVQEPTHIFNVIKNTNKTKHGRCTVTGSAPTDVFVLDYDGVIADSQHEVSSAGVAAAEQQWPSLFQGLEGSERQRVLAGVAAARPRLVKGYESMLMARLILQDPQNVENILSGTPNWDSPGGLLQTSLIAWDEEEQALQSVFEAYRANRMTNDLEGWVALNPLYEGIAEAMADCTSPFYICSSKRGDRLVRLLNAQFDLDVTEDSPRVLASLIPPNDKKIEALRKVAAKPIAANPATSLHFIDDRFETIEAISCEKDIVERYSLYLAGWGYNTEEERAVAARLPGVRVITLKQFCELLRFGIIMEVDDGCQDTAEEALNAIYKPFGADSG